VYLPKGWLNYAERAIKAIDQSDTNWGVVGVWGVKGKGEFAGYLHWINVAGKEFDGGIEVETLDEMLLILKKSSGLKFDQNLDGFHMYGADICLEARRHKMKSFAISAFCIHNSNGYTMLPYKFWKAYFYLRRKWKMQLPIKTTCTEITFWAWPMLKWNFIRAINLIFFRVTPYKRVTDPTLLYRELIKKQILNVQDRT
jgi:hypothetical protein